MKYRRILDLKNEIPFFDKWDFPCKICSYPLDIENSSCLSCNIFNKHSQQERFFDEIISVGKYFQMRTAKKPGIQSEYNLTWLILNYKQNDRLLKYCAELLKIKILEFLKQNKFKSDEIILCGVPDLENRKYQKADKLLKSIKEKTNLNYLPLLKKVKNIKEQHKVEKGIKGKFENVKDAYNVKEEYKNLLENKIIFLVDDIISTMATANECSKELKNHGAKKIYVFSLGRNILKQKQEEEKK